MRLGSFLERNLFKGILSKILTNTIVYLTIDAIICIYMVKIKHKSAYELSMYLLVASECNQINRCVSILNNKNMIEQNELKQFYNVKYLVQLVKLNLNSF